MNLNTPTCPIGQEYQAALEEVRRKRDAAQDDRTFDCYAQTRVELHRIERRHFDACPVCQIHEQAAAELR